MAISKFCPICGDILQLVEHTANDETVYWQWECPEGDWYEPADPPQTAADSGIQSA